MRAPLPKPANLKLVVAAPASVAEAATTAVSLVVTNEGAAPATGVKVDGVVSGGVLLDAQTSQGSCTSGAPLSCTLGEIAAGASVTITSSVRAADGSTVIALDASGKGDLACEATTDDNDAAATIAVLGPPGETPTVTTDVYV